MNIRLLAVAVTALCSGAALAQEPSMVARPARLAQAVAHMESRYQGEVVGISLDQGGDKAAHYHVDMRFPDTGIAKLDVDAATLEISAHERTPVPRDRRSSPWRRHWFPHSFPAMSLPQSSIPSTAPHRTTTSTCGCRVARSRNSRSMRAPVRSPGAIRRS